MICVDLAAVCLLSEVYIEFIQFEQVSLFSDVWAPFYRTGYHQRAQNSVFVSICEHLLTINAIPKNDRQPQTEQNFKSLDKQKT